MATSEVISEMHANYHTHTSRCKHAEGTPIDFCLAAKGQEVNVIGFTDHMPTLDNSYESVRMPFSELDGYCADVRAAQKAFPELEIHCGLECEHRIDFGNYIPDEFLAHPGRCEYLILGMHIYQDDDGRWRDSWKITSDAWLLQYARFAVKALESGWYRFMAHPDVFACAGCVRTPDALEASRLILRAAQDCHIPLELNANGFRKPMIADRDGNLRAPYPWRPFWELAKEYQVEVICASDAHKPSQLWGNTSECEAFAAEIGLTPISHLTI